MMKKILCLSLLVSLNAFSQAKKSEEAGSITELKTEIVQISMSKAKMSRTEPGMPNLYLIKVKNSSHTYTADREMAPCIYKALKESRKVTLRITSGSLVILGCVLD